MARDSSLTSRIEVEIFNLVNEHRRVLGLRPLAYDPLLSLIARQHSADMESGLVPFGHAGLAGRFSRAWAAYSIVEMTENVASNSGFPRTVVARMVVRAWLDSPGHRRNLEGDYVLTGIGVVRSVNGEYFATQHYARR